jgi:hypothetical protein
MLITLLFMFSLTLVATPLSGGPEPIAHQRNIDQKRGDRCNAIKTVLSQKSKNHTKIQK